MVTRYGSVAKMLDAGIFRNEQHADYLRRAMKVVPPVRDLPVDVPRGRRDHYPDDPEFVAVLGREYGIATNLDRLVTALNKLPALTKR